VVKSELLLFSILCLNMLVYVVVGTWWNKPECIVIII